jgi:hypothetical protein
MARFHVLILVFGMAPALFACSRTTGAYEPCAGKKAGDECQLCAPGDPECVETRNIKTCSADGRCGARSENARTNGFEPCLGKEAGAECRLCAPDDPNCIETMILKTCSADGRCGAGSAADASATSSIE